MSNFNTHISQSGANVPSGGTSTQTVVQFTVAEAITEDQNSAATATTGSGGSSWLSITNNSGVICDLTSGGSSGGSDGTTLCTVIAGDSISMPFVIGPGVVLRLKPTSAALTATDIVQVRVS